jgi:hypothetical protein
MLVQRLVIAKQVIKTEIYVTVETSRLMIAFKTYISCHAWAQNPRKNDQLKNAMQNDIEFLLFQNQRYLQMQTGNPILLLNEI